MKDGSGLPWCNACTAASAHVPCTTLPADDGSADLAHALLSLCACKNNPPQL